MTDEMIVLKEVSFAYGEKTVLDRLSVTVKKGEWVCLFGESGCGKSTVIRLICGLEQPTAGTVTVNAQKFCPVFQEDRLLPFLTAEENAKYFANKTDVDDLLEKAGLTEAAKKYPAALSGGMARRLAVIRALAASGDLYLLDEPFNGLDGTNIDRMIALLNEEIAGKTAVFVLHDRALAERIGCRIIELPKTRSIFKKTRRKSDNESRRA